MIPLMAVVLATLLAVQDSENETSPVDALRAKSQPTVDELRRALSSESEPLATLAAKILVHEVASVSPQLLRDIFSGQIARGRLLQAVASRPRRAIGEWIRSAEFTRKLSLAERLMALTALRLTTEETREILVAAMSDDSWERSLALAVADRMSAKQADLLVAEVHKHGLAGVTMELLLPCLSRMSERGEQHLIGLARTLSVDQRTEIVEWLGMRSSRVLQDFILDGLRGDFPLEPMLLRLFDSRIGAPDDLQRVFDLLQAPDGPMRRAAFRVLCAQGDYHPDLGEFALADPATSELYSRSLLALDLPADAMMSLLQDTNPGVVVLCLRKMSARRLRGVLERQVFSLAEKGGEVGDIAARAMFNHARPASVRRLWDLLSSERRRELHPALRHRDGWALALVDEFTQQPHDWGLRYTKIALGDTAALRGLLADYAAWPTSWLRRMEQTITIAIAAENMPAIEALCSEPDRLDAKSRAILCACLAARPDLGGAALLWKLYREQDDEIVRSEALGGLLLRPVEATQIYAQLHDDIGVESILDSQELAYEVAGSLKAPLTASEARLLARLVLVAPLSKPPAEDAVESMPANIVMVNIAGRILRSGAADIVVAAFEDAAKEARQHPGFRGYNHEYLSALLVATVFDPEVRLSIGPIVAKLILELEGVIPQWFGPALLVVADAAAAREEWQRAADAYGRAGPLLLRHPLAPLQARAFLGDDLPGTRLGLGAVYARRDLCQIRASLIAQDQPAVRRALQRATKFCYGDQRAETELRALRLEIHR